VSSKSWRGQNEVWMCERCRFALYGEVAEIMDEVLAELEVPHHIAELARIFGLTVRRWWPAGIIGRQRPQGQPA
jgi:hypothetical protein